MRRRPRRWCRRRRWPRPACPLAGSAAPPERTTPRGRLGRDAPEAAGAAGQGPAPPCGRHPPPAPSVVRPPPRPPAARPAFAFALRRATAPSGGRAPRCRRRSIGAGPPRPPPHPASLGARAPPASLRPLKTPPGPGDSATDLSRVRGSSTSWPSWQGFAREMDAAIPSGTASRLHGKWTLQCSKPSRGTPRRQGHRPSALAGDSGCITARPRELFQSQFVTSLPPPPGPGNLKLIPKHSHPWPF